jgi:cytolysin (calcineurin-like family phosphatase)
MLTWKLHFLSVVSGVSSAGHTWEGKQVGAVRGSAFTDLGGSRTIQALSEPILQFFTLRFCSSERGGGKKEKKERLLS